MKFHALSLGLTRSHENSLVSRKPKCIYIYIERERERELGLYKNPSIKETNEQILSHILCETHIICAQDMFLCFFKKQKFSYDPAVYKCIVYVCRRKMELSLTDFLTSNFLHHLLSSLFLYLLHIIDAIILLLLQLYRIIIHICHYLLLSFY